MTTELDALKRLLAVTLKMAHTLSPIDAEVWQALDEAEAILTLAAEEEEDDESP